MFQLQTYSFPVGAVQKNLMGQRTCLGLPKTSIHQYNNNLQKKALKLLQTILQVFEVIYENIIRITDLLEVIFNPGIFSGHILNWEFCPSKRLKA